jgi:hypothetical protein
MIDGTEDPLSIIEDHGRANKQKHRFSHYLSQTEFMREKVKDEESIKAIHSKPAS